MTTNTTRQIRAVDLPTRRRGARSVIVALCALLGMFAGLMTASSALAGRGPKSTFLPAEPLTLSADYCGFQIGFSFPANKEYSKILKTADGTMLITGVAKVTATNLNTGKASTANVSGPAKVTTFPDGSVTARETGRAGFVFSPADAKRIGKPTIGVTTGVQTTTVDADGNLMSFSLHGHVVVDTCAALS